MFAEDVDNPIDAVAADNPFFQLVGEATLGGQDGYFRAGTYASGSWPSVVTNGEIKLELGKITVDPGIVLNPTTEGAAPATKGSMIYDSGTDELKYYDGSWQIVSAGGLSSHVLDSETYHSATGLTVGWVISADTATTFSWKAPTGGLTAHDLTGAYHTEDATGGTGNVIVADSATTFSWQQLDYTELASIPSTFDPVAHDLTSAYHTDSGLTAGHFLKADTTTTFSWQLHGLGASDVGAYTTAEVDSAIDTDITTHVGLPNAHHSQSHVLSGTDHTASGLTAGWVISADTATTFSWKAPTSEISGSGTQYAISRWATTTSLGDSTLSENVGSTELYASVGMFIGADATSPKIVNNADALEIWSGATPTLALTLDISQNAQIEGYLTVKNSAASTINTDKFLVFETSGEIRYRSGSEAYSDMSGYITADFTTDFAAEDLANLTTAAHSSLDDAPTDAHHSETHALAVTGPHTGTLPWADLDKTSSSLADLATRTHANLSDAPTDAHHSESHVLSGSTHSATGLTVGWVIAADSATTFSWQAAAGGPGSGTQYTIPMWATTNTLGDSMISQDSGAALATVNGDLKVVGTQIYGNGTSIDLVANTTTDGPRLILYHGAAAYQFFYDNVERAQLTGAGNFQLDGTLTVGSIAAEATDVDKFLVSNAGVVKFRTGAEAYGDMDGYVTADFTTDFAAESFSNIGTRTHILSGADHTATGLTAGWVISADTATTFSWKAPTVGSGTQWDLPVWDTTSSFGDSMISQDAGGTLATVGGDLTTTGTLKVTGNEILSSTATAINLSGSNVGIEGALSAAIAAGVADYDKFLVSDTGTIKFRTGAEAYSDMDGYVTADFTTDFAAESLANLTTRTHASLSDAPEAAHHALVTVTALPLTLSTQAVTFNYNTNHFKLTGNNLEIGTDTPGTDETLTWSGTAAVWSTAAATDTIARALGMYGTANKEWVPLIFEMVTGSGSYIEAGAGATECSITSNYAGNTDWLYGLALPPTKVGYKLYYDDCRFYISDADSEDRIINTWIIGVTSAGAVTTIDTDPTDYETVGLKTFLTAARDCSSYEKIFVKFDTEAVTATDLDIRFVSLQCYYGT